MGFHVEIRIDLSAGQKRFLRAAIVVGVSIAAIGVGVAVARPTQWKPNDPLKADDLNSLSVITTDGGAKYSVGATTYCGSTTATKGDMSGLGLGAGYAGARKACAAVAGCTSSAHMCTAEEIIRSESLDVAGIHQASGWYASGYGVIVPGTTVAQNTDCSGSGGGPFTLQTLPSVSLRGPVLQADALTVGLCSDLYAVLCCD